MKIKLLFILCLHSAAIFSQEANVTIGDTNGVVISRHIYGHFAEHLGRCIYDGFYRNGAIRTDIVEALKKIKVPSLRWEAALPINIIGATASARKQKERKR